MQQHIHIHHIVLLLAAALCTLPLASCIKEQRGGCPRTLHIDLSGVDPTLCSEVTLRGRSGDKGGFVETRDSSRYGETYDATVYAGDVDYAAWGGTLRSLKLFAAQLQLPEGEQQDSLYLYHTTVPCYNDDNYDRVELHKEFATLTVDYRDVCDSIVVDGNYSGIVLFSGKPLERPFRALLQKAINAGEWTVRLPRQADDLLTMTFFRDDKSVIVSLGSLLAIGGYDWTLPDLADIWYQAEFSRLVIGITGPDPWEDGNSKAATSNVKNWGPDNAFDNYVPEDDGEEEKSYPIEFGGPDVEGYEEQLSSDY